MDTTPQEQVKFRFAGYAWLIERYGLDIIPNWHTSLITTSGIHRIKRQGNIIEEIYPLKYWPGNKLGDHLEFALKYDGTNLGTLSSLFKKIPAKDILKYVRSKPTSKYTRRLWFFYEFLTGTALDIDDVKEGNYTDLLDPKLYYTIAPAIKIRRQRINDNLLGDRYFCPTIRRTDVLRNFEEKNLYDRCKNVLSSYEPELLKRALNYLYTKETKSSFEIEHIKPNPTRTERFVALLQLAEREDFCDKKKLIDLQNRIVDPRFSEPDYRLNQNYVGQTLAWQKEKIHFVCPKPEDISDLMRGLISSHKRISGGGVHPVIQAVIVAYGFVFLHPFEDGNGRIHRFLIHNILVRRGFTPKEVMFPISASMLKNLSEYDASLEAFSRPLMALVEYSLDEDGRMTVQNDTAQWYRYIDMTPQAETLFQFIEWTIDKELVEELTFLENYDEAKRTINEIVDMPDRKVDLFIRFCLQNNGRLSAKKHESHFDFLSEDEIIRMEQVIKSTYKNRISDNRDSTKLDS